ncbi:DUF3558 domain-containing protein [Streptomyces boluensis]|uniref:DUF3558 domain-containing protein n=1 Tax=Streptomyces boluensis TaxID=1775135 RepID=A0A964XQX4_9ACTN|nr:DUF3558 domain-containing protein [Streptomyces boluensis]NBE56766.1 DUF3558 domain-containing protein [Streptomyces boluensis]
MQRRGYVPGAAALLAVLLTACSGGSGTGETADDAKPGEASASQTAEPGRYRTLADPCRSVDHGTLDAMLPGLKQLDEEQRSKAYEGSAAVTYDTDRRVGCSWKVESADATHHLNVDFERVVSYDGGVSDDSRAGEVYAKKASAADLPEPSPDEEQSSGTADATQDGDAKGKGSGDGSKSPSSGASDGKGETSESPKDAENTENTENTKSGDAKNPDGDTEDTQHPEGGESGESSTGDEGSEGLDVPPELLPRTLGGLGDEAFVDDRLSSAGSTSRHRTVTVVFRTSNVVVTIQYDEQPTAAGELPDSKELQDRARELAGRLAEQFID